MLGPQTVAYLTVLGPTSQKHGKIRATASRLLPSPRRGAIHFGPHGTGAQVTGQEPFTLPLTGKRKPVAGR